MTTGPTETFASADWLRTLTSPRAIGIVGVVSGLIAFWLARGRVLAGMNVGVWDVADAIERLVRSGIPIDERRLADPAVPLEDLAPAATA